jgi:glyoxylase I family protein
MTSRHQTFGSERSFDRPGLVSIDGARPSTYKPPHGNIGPMAIQRLTHVGICVQDMERSLRFYRDALGFQYVSELRVAGEPTDTLLQLQNVDLHACYLERDGTRIELLHYASPSAVRGESPRPMNQLGLTHLSFRVANLDDAVHALQAAGAAVLRQSRIDVPAFEAAAIFVSDPDGTLIELVQAPGDPAAAPGSG